MRAQWRRAHMVSIEKRQRGRTGKTHGDVTLSTRATPCFCPALRKRRSARPLCAPHTRSAHTHERATGTRTLPAGLFCVVVLCHQRRYSAAHWGRGHSETRVRARRLRAPEYTACLTAVSLLPFTTMLPPASFAAGPRVAKKKTPSSLGDILEDSGLSTTLSPLVWVFSLCRARSHPVLHEASKCLYSSDLG